MGEFILLPKSDISFKGVEMLIGCCPCSGAACLGLYPAVVQSLYCDLEELQTTSSLPWLSSAHDFAS